MLTCPWCKSENWKELHRDTMNPARDEYICKSCGKKFYRYENTPLERPGDPRHKEA